MPDISKQLLNLRKELGLTQRQLADKVGIDQTMISDYEMGKLNPSRGTINRFAKQGIVINLETGQVIQKDYEGKETMDIPEQVIRLRENLGLNQGQFARKIGVSQTTLCQIELGQRNLTATTLQKIRDKTGITLTLNSREVNQREEKVINEIGHVRFTFNIENEIFELIYSSYRETRETTHIYTLILNQEYFKFIKFLCKKYPSQTRNTEIDNIQKVLLLVSSNKTNYFYTLKIIGDTTGIVTFKPSKFEDVIEKPDMKEAPVIRTVEVESTKSTIEDKEESNPERAILILCQNIIQIRDLLDETLELAQKVVQSRVDKEKEVIEVKKEPKVIEVVNKVYKQEFWGQGYIYIGTKTLNNGVIFRVAPELKEPQKDWSLYESGFIYQTETHYDDGTVESGDKIVFYPSTKIQEIESSDRKGVIGYVEHKAEIVEVIYYDRFVN